MRTRKMRLISFVLALAMMLAIAPVSAFAADQNITTVINLENGYVDAANSSGATKGNNDIWSGPSGLWSLDTDNTFYNGGILSSSSLSENTIKNKIINNGTINGTGLNFRGAERELVVNYGHINGGDFSYVTNFHRYPNETEARLANALVENAVIQNYKVESVNNLASCGTATLKNSIVWGTISESSDSVILSGILPAKSEHTGTGSKSYTIEASGCIMTSTYNNHEFSINDVMCVVGDTENPIPEMTVTVVPSSPDRKVTWAVEGIDYTDNGQSITFTVPADNASDIKVVAAMEEVPLAVVNNLPVDGKNTDGTYGSKYDGWTYKETMNEGETNRDLIIYSATNSNLNNSVNIGSEQVDWNITNNGTIAGGKYTGKVKNYGNITGGTYAGSFFNCDAIKDKNANATGEGKVTCGVFTPKADFGAQSDELNLTWLNVKNGTINNVDKFSMASVVGVQEVTVKPSFSKDLFRGWTYSGNISNAVADQLEKQKNNYELTLTLDGDAEDSINLMPMIDGEPFGITMLDGKATVNGTDAMTIVAGVAIGAGAAVLTYHIGTELYAKQVLGDGVAVPKTREEVALKAWELAGKPAVAVEGEPLSETAQAEKWAVESGLMQNVDGSFNGAKKMSKLKALRVLDAAKKLGYPVTGSPSPSPAVTPLPKGEARTSRQALGSPLGRAGASAPERARTVKY